MITILYNVFVKSFIVLLISMLSVNYLPDKLFADYPIEPQNIDTSPYNSYILEWNSKLTDSKALEFIQLNQIRGPESLAFSKAGLIYTGLADGRIVELDPMNKFKLREVTRFNKKMPQVCQDHMIRSDECGRFLQMRFNDNDSLFGLETNHGLFKIDTKNGQLTPLGPKNLSPINLYNGFAFDPVEPNIVYLTTSSTRWTLSQIMWSLLEIENSGQILAMDISTGKRVVLLDKLRMPNGLDIDVKRDQIVYSESTISRISSLSLSKAREALKTTKDGEKANTLIPKVLILIVPGNPDNVIIKGDTAYIAMPRIRQNGQTFIDHLSDKPGVRKAFARAVFGIGKIIEFINNNVYKHEILEKAFRELKSGHFIYYIVLEEKSGCIVYNLETHAQRFLGSDKFGYLSEAQPDGFGNFYLASYDNRFIVKVPNKFT